MEVINDLKKLSNVLENGIKKYNNISFSVAWASTRNSSFNLLKQNKSKMRNCVVGLHFYQTDSNFIEEFLEDESVKFIKKSKGIFHPKIYLFWNSSTDWTAIIGSANFTESAFKFNDEVCTVIKNDNETLFDNITKIITSYFKQANNLSDKDFEDYKKNQIKQNKKKQQNDDFKPVIINSHLNEILNFTWEEYYEKIRETPDFENRIEVLSKAKELFSQNKFKDMNETTRKNIGGVIKKGNSIDNWCYFGRMPSSYFANRLKDSYKYLSKQFELLPTSKEISKNDYEKFVKYFINKQGHGYSISTVSRLLTMKFPNQFYCLTSANETALLESFDIKSSIQKTKNKPQMYERYWDEVVEPIRKTKWYKQKQPNSKYKEELLAWKFRVAFLDTLLYGNN